jgi:hypothetical protein
MGAGLAGASMPVKIALASSVRMEGRSRSNYHLAAGLRGRQRISPRGDSHRQT